VATIPAGCGLLASTTEAVRPGSFASFLPVMDMTAPSVPSGPVAGKITITDSQGLQAVLRSSARPTAPMKATIR
jgi:hypothetical protein